MFDKILKIFFKIIEKSLLESSAYMENTFIRIWKSNFNSIFFDNISQNNEHIFNINKLPQKTYNLITKTKSIPYMKKWSICLIFIFYFLS